MDNPNPFKYELYGWITGFQSKLPPRDMSFYYVQTQKVVKGLKKFISCLDWAWNAFSS